MPDGFKSLSEIFNSDPGLLKIRDSVKRFDVVDDFGKIFPDLAKIAEPVKTERSILFLRVENSVWRSELRFMEKVIADKINKYYNEERIKGIRFIP